MTFEEYLVSKKINKYAFQGAESQRFEEWKDLFREMHPESFTAQKKVFDKFDKTQVFVERGLTFSIRE